MHSWRAEAAVICHEHLVKRAYFQPTQQPSLLITYFFNHCLNCFLCLPVDELSLSFVTSYNFNHSPHTSHDLIELGDLSSLLGKIALILKAFTHWLLMRECKMFGCEMFRSKLVIHVVTWIYDRDVEKHSHREVLTWHSEFFGYSPSYKVETENASFTSS